MVASNITRVSDKHFRQWRQAVSKHFFISYSRSTTRAKSFNTGDCSEAASLGQNSNGNSEGESSGDGNGDDGDDDPSHLLIYLLHKRAKHVDETVIKTEALAQYLLHNLSGAELQALVKQLNIGTPTLAQLTAATDNHSQWLKLHMVTILLSAIVLVCAIWVCDSRSAEALAAWLTALAALCIYIMSR